MSTAHITSENGHSVIHLPPELQLAAGEVSVKQVGQTIILVPVNADPWQIFTASVEQFTPDFMQDRNQPPQQVREPLDE